MITKQEIADLVLLYINGGEVPDSESYDERDVWKWVDLLSGDAITAQIMASDWRDVIQSAWVKKVKGVIEWDSETDECYLMLPCNLANLPDDEALRDITFIKDKKFSIRLLKDGQLKLVRGLTSRDTDGTSYYGELSGKRVTFMDMPANLKGTAMRLSVVAVGDAYDADDPIPMPPGSAKIIADEIIQRFLRSKQSGTKENNDGNQ